MVIIKNFTMIVKIKVFTKEDDIFDDVFRQKSSLGEILHMAQIQFDQEKLQEFNRYREQRLANVPLDKLHIEPIREPTPNISRSGSSREGKSKSKSERESTKKSDKQSKIDHNRSEASIKDTVQSIEKHDQWVLSPKQAETPAPLTKPTSPIIVDLEKEWENFNELINTEE